MTTKQTKAELIETATTLGHRDPEALEKLTKAQIAAEIEALEAELDAVDFDEDEDDEPELRTVVPRKYKQRYGKDQNCGDDFAHWLKQTEVPLAEIAAANGIDFGRWGHLNPGMQRMNLGNVLRGMAKRGEEVVRPDEPELDKAA